MVMADGVHVRPRLVNAAVDHPFAVHLALGRRHRFGIEGEFEQVRRLDQFGTARPRQEIAPRIVGMAHADVAETVEHALMGDNAISKRKLIAQVVE